MLARSFSSGSLGSRTTAASSSSQGGYFRSSSSSALARTISRATSGYGLSGSMSAVSADDMEKEETGAWNYLVVDSKGIRPRLDAKYCKYTKYLSSSRHPQGCILEIERRRKSGWTTFLGLKTGGWVFDVSPKDAGVRMVEVEVTKGEWMYEMCGCEHLALLPYPAASSKVRSLDVSEVLKVISRVRPVAGKGSYLELADGRGWVLDFADGQRVVKQLGDSTHTSIPMLSPESAATVPLQASPEVGSWDYVVLDPRGLSLRSKPTCDASFKINRKLEEGELVSIDERIFGDCTTFLHMKCPQGWAFDRKLGNDSHVRMMEVCIERGSWHYRVMAERGIALRSRCSFSDSAKCGKGPLKGDVIEVAERVQVGSTTFLKLNHSSSSTQDERWIFDSKVGQQVLEGPLRVQIFPMGAKALVTPEDGVQLRSAPTPMPSAITKMRLLHNARVDLHKTCAVGVTQYAFVSKPGGGGFEGWILMESLQPLGIMPNVHEHSFCIGA